MPKTGPSKPALPAISKPVNADSAVSYQGMTMALPASRDYAALHVKPTGKRVEYDLTVAETTVNITGKKTTAMTINGLIPGPTLAFTEGDVAVIRVHNTLKTETSIHWHGLLVPYDFIVTIPASGAYELRASAQDGSGYASAFLGQGKRVLAPKIPKPDLYQMTKVMSQMPGGNRSGLSFRKYQPLVRMVSSEELAGEATPPKADMNMPGMAEAPVAVATTGSMTDMPGMVAPALPTAEGSKTASAPAEAGMPMAMFDKFNYQQLRSVEKTVFPANRQVREVTLNLPGDMRRYIWGFNGKTLSGADAILVRRGEIVRFRLVNATMMFHPLHLHGHFFRVLNGQGDYSPLKHTVNLSPMETVVIEFLADEENDWFFHCHILYHLVGGMGQVVHYEGTTPDADVVAARTSPASPMKDPAGDKSYYFAGQLDAGFPTSYLALSHSNQRNAFVFGANVNRNSSTSWMPTTSATSRSTCACSGAWTRARSSFCARCRWAGRPPWPPSGTWSGPWRGCATCCRF